MRLLCRRHAFVQITDRQPQFCKTCPGQCIIGLVRGRLLQAVEGAGQIEVRLLCVRQGDVGRGRVGVCADRLVGQYQGRGLVVLGHGNNGLQCQGIAVAGIGCQCLVKQCVGTVHLPDGQCRGGLLHAGIAMQQYRGIVQCPLHGITRAHDRLCKRCLTRLRNGLLTTGDHDAATIVANQYPAFIDGYARLLFVHLHQEFGTFNGGIGKRRDDLQCTWVAADKVGRTLE